MPGAWCAGPGPERLDRRPEVTSGSGVALDRRPDVTDCLRADSVRVAVGDGDVDRGVTALGDVVTGVEHRHVPHTVIAERPDHEARLPVVQRRGADLHAVHEEPDRAGGGDAL